MPSDRRLVQLEGIEIALPAQLLQQWENIFRLLQTEGRIETDLGVGEISLGRKND